MDLAEEMNILVRRGAWYSYNGENISQGRDNAIKYMEDKPEFAKEVEKLVREKLEMGAVVSANSVTPTISDSGDEDEDEIDEVDIEE